DGGWLFRLGGREISVAGAVQSDGALLLSLDGVARRARVLANGIECAVFIDGKSWRFELIDPLAAPIGAEATVGKLTAQMPGRVTGLFVAPETRVRRGDPLIVVEAMKMEHTIVAPFDGVVAAVRFAVGELVEEGVELIALTPDDGDRA